MDINKKAEFLSMIHLRIIKFTSILTIFILFFGILHIFSPVLGDLKIPEILDTSSKVLAQSNKPDFTIAKTNGYGFEKIINFSANEKPQISLNNYQLEGEANIKIYQSGVDTLLKYLTHDKDNNQTQKIDSTDFKLLSELKKSVVYNQNTANENIFDLPIQDIGIFYLKIDLKNVSQDAMVIRTNLGVTVNQGKDNLLFWGQDLQTLRVINDATLTTYNLENGVNIISQAGFNNEGIAKAKSDNNTDIALAQKEDDVAIVPVNLQYMGFRMRQSDLFSGAQKSEQATYLYTDRPIYKPGDKLNFKAMVRSDTDLNWVIPSGKIKVRIDSLSGSSDDVKKMLKEYTLNTNGTINGNFDLPKTITPGDYVVVTSKINPINDDDEFVYGNAYFSVQNYRKPISELKINLEKDRLILGEKNSLNLEAKYLSGVPAGNNKVKVNILEDIYAYDYDDDVDTDQTPAFKYFQYSNYGDNPSAYSRDVVLDNNGQAKLEIDTSEFVLNKPENNSGRPDISNQKRVFTVQTILDDKSTVPVVSSSNFLGYPAQFYFTQQNKYVSAVVQQPFENEISLKATRSEYNSKVANQNVTAKLKRKWWDKKVNPNNKYDQYEEKTEDLSSLNFKTDSKGNFKFSFKPEKNGSYEITLKAIDSNQKASELVLNVWVNDSDKYLGNPSNNGIKLSLDKEEYKVGDKAILTINSDFAPRDLLLINGRRLENSYQVLNLNKSLIQVEIPVLESDLPNTNLQVKSFNGRFLDKDFIPLKINTDGRKLELKIKSDKEKYNPKDTVNLEVESKNNGLPISAEISLGVVDKAIYALKQDNTADILSSFYYNRYFGVPESNSLEPIYARSSTGGGGGGGDSNGNRSNFKDTAFWNAEIKTDKDGKAKLSFKLPDNLTTWVINTTGIANTVLPKVGSTQIEIKTSKPVSLYPILPNLVRLSDELDISTNLLNDDSQDHIFEVSLNSKDFDITALQASPVNIKAKSSQIISWKIKPKNLNPEALLQFKAVAKDNPQMVDSLESKLPIFPFEFKEESYNTRDIPGIYDIKLNPDSDLSKSSIKLNISSTIVGSLPTAMDYLIGYPYGCSEQTTSKLAPIVIAKQNPTLFPNALKDQNTDKLIETSLENLALLRNSDGGWGFWNEKKSDPFITAYVVQYLNQALLIRPDLKDKFLTDVAIDTYFRNQINGEDSIRPAIALYGLSLMDPNIFNISTEQNKDLKYQSFYDFKLLSDDILAMAVMANFKRGNTDSKNNGLNELINRGKIQGDGIYWNEGDSKNFGSKTASTAMAVSAILQAGGDREIVTKGVRYLESNRKNGYWGNTFATSWSIQALTQFAKSAKELNPDYSYEVYLDDKKIGGGKINKPYQNESISLDLKQVQLSGSKLEIKQIGAGQLYSTLKTLEYRTDQNTQPTSNTIKLNKEYLNNRGENTVFKVGDIVKVRFTVSGVPENTNYALIEDELPAGMVAINSDLDNEKFSTIKDQNIYQSAANIIYTSNGVLINTNLVKGNSQVSYFARVVTNGSFSVPPSKISLMYAPEINASTSSIVFKSSEDGFTPTNITIANTEIPIISEAKDAPEAGDQNQAVNEALPESKQEKANAVVLVVVLSVLLFSVLALVVLIYYINKKTKINSIKDLTSSLRSEFDRFHQQIKNQFKQNTVFEPNKKLLSHKEIEEFVEKNHEVELVHPTEADVRHLPEKTEIVAKGELIDNKVENSNNSLVPNKSSKSKQKTLKQAKLERKNKS